MNESELLWEHFKLNAEQRLRGFNFFLVISIFANGGVLTAIERELHLGWVLPLGLFLVALALVFWLVDARSRQLIRLTTPRLKELETSFSHQSRIFAIDAKGQGKYVRFTFAIRAMLVCQLLFGLGVAIYGGQQLWSGLDHQVL